MKKLLKPRHPKISEIDNKIQQDVNRKFSFLIERKGSVPFTPPPKDWLNGMFTHDVPTVFFAEDGKVIPRTEGKIGHPSIYYIPKTVHEKLIGILDEFQMPAEHRPNLIWAFLNMVFASCSAAHSNKVYKELREWDEDFIEFMELLPSFESEEKILRGFTLVYQDRSKHLGTNGKYVLGKLKSRTFGIGNANGFLQEMLQNFKQSPHYEDHHTSYELLKKHGHLDMFHGHKNAEKQHQSFYAWAVFEFLRETLFLPALEFYGDDEKCFSKLEELKKKFSRRNRFVFIGRLLALSGLLYEKEEFDDEELFDIIRKKLEKGIRADREKNAEHRKHNAESTDGKMYILPYSSLF